jgi:hypothetical protein
LDTYHLLFMSSNSMREGRQHEYYWSPLLTSEVTELFTDRRKRRSNMLYFAHEEDNIL